MASLLVVVALLVGPLIVAVVLRWRDSGVPPEPATEFTATAERTTVDPSVSATLSAQWSVDRVLVAPAWSGLVTEVMVHDGVVVVEGQPVMSVDGVVRFAGATPRPFHRELPAGAVGADVGQLQQLLIRLGLITDEVQADRMDRPTVMAVRALAALLGVPEPARSVFDPGWMVWMPSGTPVNVGSFETAAGVVAPPAGTTLAVAAPALVGATVRIDQVGDAVPFGEVVLRTSDGRSAEVEVDPDSGAVADPATVSELVSPPGDDEPVLVALSPRSPSAGVSFPGAAFVRDELGGGCVWYRGELADPWDAYSFTTHENVAGNVVIESSEAIDALVGTEVLLNADEVLPSDRCPG